MAKGWRTRTLGSDDRANGGDRGLDNMANLLTRREHSRIIESRRTKTYDGAQQRQQTALGLVQLFLRFGLDVERSLARHLVGRRIDLDFVLGHNLLHDFTECRGLAVLASIGKVHGRQVEGIDEDGGLGNGLNPGASAPGGGSGSLGRGGGSERGESDLGVRIDGCRPLLLLLGSRSRFDQGREWIRSSLELVASLIGLYRLDVVGSEIANLNVLEGQMR